MRRIWIQLILLASLLALVGCRSGNEWRDGDDFEIRLTLDRDEIYIGQIVSATLEILHPKDVQPHFDDPEDDDKIRVRERRWGGRQLDDESTLTAVEFYMTSFDIGEHSPFKGAVTFHRDGEQIAETPFDENSFTVLSKVQSDRDAPRDVAENRVFPRRFPRWVPVLILIAALAAALGALAAKLLARRQPREQQIEIEPPHEVALRDLRRLRDSGWIELENFEPFYVELSRIVRIYIEGRFELRAPEQTTEEFIRAAAESSRLDSAHREMVTDFLHQSDMVKFARYRATADMMGSALEAAERFVLETSGDDSAAGAKEDGT